MTVLFARRDGVAGYVARDSVADAYDTNAERE
jgi:hypothetical protein